jgi:hypothetical protein
MLQVDQYMTHSQPLLCGPASEQLAEWVAKHLKAHSSTSLAVFNAAAKVELLQKLSEFFSPPGPASTMWQLAAAAAAHLAAVEAAGGTAVDAAASPTASGSLQHALSSCSLLRSTSSVAGSMSGSSTVIRPLSAKDSCGFQHVAAARAALVSTANQLELSVRASARGKPAMAAAKQGEVLQEAALLQLQAGQVEQCCELFVEAGEWDRALVLAPAVSQEYWGKLLKRRADVEAKRGAAAGELLPLLLAAGQAGALVELLMAQKQFGLAASVGAVQACG